MSALKHALQKIRHKTSTDDTGSSRTASEPDSISSIPTQPNDPVRTQTAPAVQSVSNGITSSPSRTSSLRKSKTDLTFRRSSPRSSGIFSRVQGLSGSHEHRHSHSPIRVVKEKLGIASDSSEDGEVGLNREGEKTSKNQLKKLEKLAEKEERARQVEEREREHVAKVKQILAEAEEIESEAQKARYGTVPINGYAGVQKPVERFLFADINHVFAGKQVTFRARLHAMRKMSASLVFFLFRQGTRTIQGVLHQHNDVSKYFLFWAERLDLETIVLVKGTVQSPKTKAGEVTGATVHKWEIAIDQIFIEGRVSTHLPYSVQDGEITAKIALQEGEEGHAISQRVRMMNRVIDLRTSYSQAVLRIQSGLCHYFRDYLDSQGFIEIHTPKLQGGATESGASVFKVEYFSRKAFLAQSPQLCKQMSISADFERVYEIGAVFRAENSNTHRHLTEYTGLDLEMAIDQHYHEVLQVLIGTFKHIFKSIYERYRHEIDIVKIQYPHEDLTWLEETPIIPFAEAVRMLNATGWRDQHGNQLPEDKDLGTRDEIQLGKVVKETYKTDFYVIDKFPVSARPFYAMPDPNDPNITNSFDIFLRGQEILSGGQRIHDAELLLKNLDRWKIDPRSMDEYVQAFEYGMPPHGGGGIGLERMLMLLLNLGDIRNASMFHRDPKSFPEKPVVVQLRHPEASTTDPPWQGRDRVLAGLEFQPLEKLIANYGDASNTSWLEERMKVWRDPLNGAAIGYYPQDGYAITVGNPLCHEAQYAKTIAGYLQFIKRELGLKPLWLLVGSPVEEVLADRFNWHSFSVVAEQRLNPANAAASHDADVQRKIRHAEKEGIKVVDFPIGKPVPEDIMLKIDHRVKDWLAHRKGKQVHLTNVNPWKDMEHRQYHYAVGKDGTIVALVVLAQLSPTYGWQVKYALDFPAAPGGTIEYLITHSLKAISDDGATTCTFGAGASPQLVAGHNMKGAKLKMLAKAYSAIINELKLTNKSEFREKLGAKNDPSYISYPPHGMGPMAVKAILTFFEDP